jgi:hypothetical protein
MSLHWRDALTTLRRGLPPAPAGSPPPDPTGHVVEYVQHAPTPQGAIDLFEGEWSSRFPDDLGVVAGTATLFDDARIRWMLDRLPPLDGWNVLELGPLEGAHTAMLHAAGARVTAIEANPRAFLRCLVTKELLQLDRCRFLLGDFGAYLAQPPGERFDLVLMSGVLYHAEDPLTLLERVASIADRVAIWTHYYDADALAALPDEWRHFDPEPVSVSVGGRVVQLHRRRYQEAARQQQFCGGPLAYASWLERDDLLHALGHVGFATIEVGSDSTEHPFGPNILLLASKG